MNTTEIVIREMQGNTGFQVRQLLAVGVREPRQSAKLHSHREVLPFHVASRDVTHTRFADSDFGYNLRDSWWGVPRIRPVILSEVSEQLYQLGKVNVQPKDFGNGLRVEVKPVRGQLDLVCQPLMQIANETHGIRDTALSNDIGRNQLCVRVLCDENPLIAYLRAVLFANTALFLSDEAPYFVTLYIAGGWPSL